jgi:GNAT superfamily N-acetyltransferase
MEDLMVELVEVQPDGPCHDPEIRQHMSSSKKARFTKHFIARQDGNYVGFVAIDKNPGVDYLVLYELFVSKRLRGAGLGASLLDEVEKWAASEGYERVTLFPSPLELGFPAARLVAWYKRHGYTERPDFPSELEKWILSGGQPLS